jgi:hypothetical protein
MQQCRIDFAKFQPLAIDWGKNHQNQAIEGKIHP